MTQKPQAKKTNELTMTPNAFLSELESVEDGSPRYSELYHCFAKELNEALKGRICSRERMLKLYPILFDINEETREIRAYEAKYALKKETLTNLNKP